jgi:hypothetical protein
MDWSNTSSTLRRLQPKTRVIQTKRQIATFRERNGVTRSFPLSAKHLRRFELRVFERSARALDSEAVYASIDGNGRRPMYWRSAS